VTTEEPPRQATALSYEAGETAPRVVATGRGYIAERIIAAAREAGVPVKSDPALANALSALDLGDEIPDALYRAVAETVAWAYRLDAQAGRPSGPAGRPSGPAGQPSGPAGRPSGPSRKT
jgi:flagellar biosynthesis protein